MNKFLMKPFVFFNAENVRIQLDDRSYDIQVGQNLLQGLSGDGAVPAGTAALVVTNETVQPLYGSRLVVALKQRYPVVHTVTLPDGEEHKNWQTLNLIFDALLQHGCDRKTVLFALGGGVVGDMTGFAAASYMRGVPFVQVPTTLLAQVDSSVGGKTAINHPLGKNMIGAFYQPQLVVCDLGTLNTLPPRELSAGLAEIIKYGPIADMAFFDWIEANLDALLARDPVALAHAVKRSCEIKAWVVGQDERESGIRAILNFGHTFGHALEKLHNFQELSHGEAVGIGMVLACQVGERLGVTPAGTGERVRQVLKQYGLPTEDRFTWEEIVEATALDKKSDGATLRMILLSQIGESVSYPITREQLKPLL